MRREKIIRSSLEADVAYPDLERVLGDWDEIDVSEVFITSSAAPIQGLDALKVTRTANHKCGRCWRHLPEVASDGALCNRCETVLDA